jgi:hypothetical protein
MYYANLYATPADLRTQLGRATEDLRRHPGTVVQLGLSLGSLSEPTYPRTPLVPAGALDPQIEALADWLNGLESIVYLRIGYEFDLLGGQYGPPEAYKAAYRHIVDLLREREVDNASYVWHSSGAFWRAIDYSGLTGLAGTTDRSGRTDPALTAFATLAQALPDAATDLEPISAFYPGRDYVDYFGISYWGDSCCGGRSSAAARAVYEARTREILDQARALGLPLMLAETTPAYIGSSSGDESVRWLDRYFGLIEDYDIRQFSLIVPDWRAGGFFAAPFWNGYWPDARVHRFPDTRERYLSEVGRGRYLHWCPELLRTLGAPAGHDGGPAAAAAPLPGRQDCAARVDGFRSLRATRRGAVFAFSISKPARVTIAIRRRGTRRGARSVRRDLLAGPATLRVRARRALAPGRYLATLVTDSYGVASPAVRTAFTVRR